MHLSVFELRIQKGGTDGWADALRQTSKYCSNVACWNGTEWVHNSGDLQFEIVEPHCHVVLSALDFTDLSQHGACIVRSQRVIHRQRNTTHVHLGRRHLQSGT